MAEPRQCQTCGHTVSADRTGGDAELCDRCGSEVSVRATHVSPRVRLAALHAAPWAISVGVHVAIAVVLMFVFILISDKSDEPITVPYARLSDTPGSPAELRADPAPAEAEKTVEPAEEDILADESDVILAESATSDDAALASLIESEPQQADPFELAPAGGDLEPVSRFYGDGGNAHHIVYVVDCSGSMYNALGTPRSPGPVRMEMLRSIGELARPQDFHVIFFAAGVPKECPPRKLVPATDSAKLGAARFMKTIRPDVQTDPIPALRRAFAVLERANRRYPGKVIFLLTDGEDFPDQARLAATLEELNADGEVCINTILYTHRAKAAGTNSPLRRIARAHGGWFKHVVENE